jgi:hypothetical protein
VSQLNVIVLHVDAERADEFLREWEADELPRWRRFHEEGKFLNARLFRADYGTDERPALVKFVIVAEVPSMAEHGAHDDDPGFQDWNRRADAFQPEAPLVYGGDLLHQVGGAD